MKEAQMYQPNMLGHYHRDIVLVVSRDRYYVTCTLSCGHTIDVSRQFYKKYKDHATLCIKCSK